MSTSKLARQMGWCLLGGGILWGVGIKVASLWVENLPEASRFPSFSASENLGAAEDIPVPEEPSDESLRSSLNSIQAKLKDSAVEFEDFKDSLARFKKQLRENFPDGISDAVLSWEPKHFAPSRVFQKFVTIEQGFEPKTRLLVLHLLQNPSADFQRNGIQHFLLASLGDFSGEGALEFLRECFLSNRGKLYGASCCYALWKIRTPEAQEILEQRLRLFPRAAEFRTANTLAVFGRPTIPTLLNFSELVWKEMGARNSLGFIETGLGQLRDASAESELHSIFASSKIPLIRAQSWVALFSIVSAEQRASLLREALSQVDDEYLIRAAMKHVSEVEVSARAQILEQWILNAKKPANPGELAALSSAILAVRDLPSELQRNELLKACTEKILALSPQGQQQLLPLIFGSADKENPEWDRYLTGLLQKSQGSTNLEFLWGALSKREQKEFSGESLNLLMESLRLGLANPRAMPLRDGIVLLPSSSAETLLKEMNHSDQAWVRREAIESLEKFKEFSPEILKARLTEESDPLLRSLIVIQGKKQSEASFTPETQRRVFQDTLNAIESEKVDSVWFHGGENEIRYYSSKIGLFIQSQANSNDLTRIEAMSNEFLKRDGPWKSVGQWLKELRQNVHE